MTRPLQTINREPADIIAFFAHGRSIGYANFSDGMMYRYGVKIIKGNKAGQDFSKRVYQSLSPLLKTIRPGGVIVVERVLHPGMYGVLVATLPKLLQRFALSDYRFVEISLPEVKEDLCGDKRATHRALITAIAQRDATLLEKIKGGPTSRKMAYWTPALMAAALAFAAENQFKSMTSYE